MRFVCVLCLVAAVAAGCATAGAGVQKTQLEMREFQTKSYQTADTKMVLKAVANVLQDEGFIIKEANTELGILSGAKELDVESGTTKFFSTLFMGSDAKWDKNSVIEATANVSEFGPETRVRIIFQAKTYDNKGGVSKLKQIDDENYYQDFFAKVDKGVFIEGEGL